MRIGVRRSADNPFLKTQEAASELIVAGFNAWRDLRDRMGEHVFLTLYGSPIVQAAAGVDRTAATSSRQATESLLHQELLQKRIAELRSRIGAGALVEGLLRAALYVGMSHGSLDERTIEALRRVRSTKEASAQLSLAEFKRIAREQYLMLLVDEDASLAALPSLLPTDQTERRNALSVLEHVLAARGSMPKAAEERFERIAVMFDSNFHLRKDAAEGSEKSAPAQDVNFARAS